MQAIAVVSRKTEWLHSIPGIEVVEARSYLTDAKYSELRGIRVFNLCRSYRYQTTGYYVSLLAAARGQKPLPAVSTIQDLKDQSIIRNYTEELDQLIQKSLKGLQSDEYTLSIYFGHNMASKYEKLAGQLFRLFPSPFLRLQFWKKSQRWLIKSINPIPAGEVSEDHREFARRKAIEFFSRKRFQSRRAVPRYDMAILHNPEEEQPPSDSTALSRFQKAAEEKGFYAEFLTKEDYGRLSEFDALFIRETTAVNHHTYRFARKALGEGLVVIDDPLSILRCTNKVYLAELLTRYRIRTPRTLIAHRGNLDTLESHLGFPIILKEPDSSFSQGVVKASDPESLKSKAEAILNKSDLFIAQEFLPTEYDWRVGILNRTPLYVCKYFMARGHWQVMNKDEAGEQDYGDVECMAVEDAPQEVVRTALRAANLIGDGLYGVDLKYSAGKAYVIEVNDNPSIDGDCEDEILGLELYRIIMDDFLRRVQQRTEGKRSYNVEPL
ncbi:MAG TPA: RimK family alpha-L-glutamate ligase [Leptospiraceae bacterium]|nr:RimK family alpha-L-glutamate ligase [Spirochaetaceae bacterium]HBS05167.1 RimK family alpha-L-glutamate ligase [Leptospiraceae bacterium]|tara:strand:+ start:2655 stop:4139 length:1485 start_codon:yes stop_codon:yes gene_type:complete